MAFGIKLNTFGLKRHWNVCAGITAHRWAWTPGVLQTSGTPAQAPCMGDSPLSWHGIPPVDTMLLRWEPAFHVVSQHVVAAPYILSEEMHSAFLKKSPEILLSSQPVSAEKLLIFPDSSVGKEPACNAGDPSSIPGLGRSTEEGKGYPLQYYGLQNSMDCIVHRMAKSQTRLNDFHSCTQC